MPLLEWFCLNCHHTIQITTEVAGETVNLVKAKHALTFTFLKEDLKKHVVRRHFTCFLEQFLLRWFSRILSSIWGKHVVLLILNRFLTDSYKQNLCNLVTELQLSLQSKFQLKLEFNSLKLPFPLSTVQPRGTEPGHYLSKHFTISGCLHHYRTKRTDREHQDCCATSSMFLILLPNKHGRRADRREWSHLNWRETREKKQTEAVAGKEKNVLNRSQGTEGGSKQD